MKKLFRKNIFLIFGSIALGLIAVVTFWSNYQKQIIVEKGDSVEVKILESPGNCRNITTRGGYCKLQFDNLIFTKRAGNKFCHLVSNKEKVTMLTNKNRDKFIFYGEFNNTNYYYSLVLFLISIIIFLKGVKT